MEPHILLIEDDRTTATAIAQSLQQAGYRLTIAEDGYRGLGLALTEPFDLILLDWMLPDIDGVSVCRRLRQESEIPLLLLTQRSDVIDRVIGLQAGADDYLIKPVHPQELIARIRARLRHRSTSTVAVHRCADLAFWPAQQRAERAGRAIELTRKESKLLQALMDPPSQVCRRETLMKAVWGPQFDGDSNVLEAYIKLLRRKLESDGESRLIETVHKVGYVLRAPKAPAPQDS